MPATVLPSSEWRARAAAHAERADALTAGHRARRAAGETHAIEDFLHTYYATRPGQLRRWHPGADVTLEGAGADVDERLTWRWYTPDGHGARVDVDAFLADRGATVRFVQGYKRVLPLSRLLNEQKCDILHLHWPEAYYAHRGDGLDLFRTVRFPLDLHQAARKAVLVTTAHNFLAHDRGAEMLIGRNVYSAT